MKAFVADVKQAIQGFPYVFIYETGYSETDGPYVVLAYRAAGAFLDTRNGWFYKRITKPMPRNLRQKISDWMWMCDEEVQLRLDSASLPDEAEPKDWL